MCKDIFDRKTLQHLRDKAGDVETFEEYKKLLREYYDKYKEKYGAEIFFAYSDNKYLNAQSKMGNKVNVYYAWTVCLIDNIEDLVKRVFDETLGHEMTHKEGDPVYAIVLLSGIILVVSLLLFLLIDKWICTIIFLLSFVLFIWVTKLSKTISFFSWVNEVHADYGGIKKAFDGNASLGIESLEFKKDNKKEKDTDKKPYTHPTWGIRIQMVREKRYDQDLVRKIADIKGYKSEFFINIACHFFEPIELY